jgi:Domain of unknown function (DUF4157)
MSDRTFGHKKAGTSTFSNPSLVSPTTPTLANPTPSFGLPTNNVIQTATKESTNLQEVPGADEQSLSPQAIGQQSFGHDISRIALRRPQAKLTVGAPNDVYEQEADRVADQVMSMPDAKPSVQREEILEEGEELQAKSLAGTITPLVQREAMPAEEEELQTKSLGNATLQREATVRKEEPVQMKSLLRRSTDGSLQATDDIENQLSSSKGRGNPLPDGVRAFMEPRFGTDFSHVRVHSDSNAVQMSQNLNAEAFTHGNDIYYGSGNSAAKDDLTAHELTHVVQQTGRIQHRQEQQTIQSEKSDGVPAYLKSIFSSQQDQTSLYRKELKDFQQVHSDKTLEQYHSQLAEPSQRVEISQTDPLQRIRRMTRVQNPPPGKTDKQVSSVAMGRIGKAEEAIKHTKSVFSYGAGNQTEALKATNFNSQFRLMVMRDNQQLLDALGETSFWKLTDEVKPIAAANPEALTAAKADLAHGGNCGEHAKVAFDYLRIKANGETLNRSAVNGLDHAFILIGDVKKDSDSDIVVADPWPTKATATTWEDHFAYTKDRANIQVSSSMVADGQNVKAVIAAGLTLTQKGKEVAAMKRSDKETEELLKRTKELHFWTHPNTAAPGHDHDYHL